CEALGLWTDDLAAEIGKGGGLAIVIQNDLAAHDPALARLLEKYARVLYLATNEDATSRLAGIVHPVTPHSEFDGSFTNFEGRVQLFRRSVTPRGDALTVMELLRRIAARLGVEFGWVNRNAIWAEMARAVPEFEGMSPSAIGDSGMLLASLRPRAAGTAGSAGESEPQAAERG
ncbi:MAG: hypothetical protein QUU85_15410, partial [Candidatus Eisenbacteria bacterium]|nr:hypothetical protein [Candidatus Eisenbacteria bacterium]